MRAMQHTQFRAKNAKNDLKPTDFLKCNFYFETEGVCFKELGLHVNCMHVDCFRSNSQHDWRHPYDHLMNSL